MSTEATQPDDTLADLIAEVREFLDEREGESALMALNDAPVRTNGAEAELLRAEAQIQMAEDFDEALITLERAARAKADPQAVAALYARIRMADINLMKQASLLTWITERLDDAALCISLATLQVRRGQFLRAETAASRALAIDPGLPEAHRALYVAILRGETPERAVDAIREALVVSRRDPRYPALMSTLAGLEPAEADALKIEMLDRWPQSLKKSLRSGDLDISINTTFIPEEGGIYSMALNGDTAAAIAKARAIVESKQGRGMSAKLEVVEDVLPRLPGPGERTRPLVVDDNSEVIVSAPSQSGVTLMCFTDLTHRMNYDFEIIDAFAARTGAASMFLRDHSFDLFFGGIGSLGPDRASTIAALRDRLIALGTQRLVVVGLSSSGISALSYGRELGAADILGLSISSSVERFVSGKDRRARMLISRLSRKFTPEETDLRSVLPGIPADTPIRLYFGAENATDRGHAEDLEGMENLTLHPIEGHARHQVLPELIRQGIFQDALAP